MKSSKLRFVETTDMFGTSIRLASSNGSYDQEIVSGFNPSDPLKNMDKKLSGGFLFRSPNIHESSWPSTIGSLCNTEGRFKLEAELFEKKDGAGSVTAWARFENQDDAAMFAWSQVDVWQKWSDEKEAAFREDLKKVPESAKIEVDKDGKIRATIKVETLGN